MATDDNIHAGVSNCLAQFTRTNRAKPTRRQPGVAVIAVSIFVSSCRHGTSGAARGRGKPPPPMGGRLDVQKLCNICVLSLSWNFFV